MNPRQIVSVEIKTFEAATYLTKHRPVNTEQAQYSLPYPVACAIIRGKVGVDEITRLDDPEILALSERIEMSVDPALESRFPAEALAKVIIRTTDGRELETGPVTAPGDSDVTFDDLLRKSELLLGETKANEIADHVHNCPQGNSVAQIANCLRN